MQLMSTTVITTLSLHDAFRSYGNRFIEPAVASQFVLDRFQTGDRLLGVAAVLEAIQDELTRNRSEEHTSELQSRRDLVCRLLLEKKKIPARSDEVSNTLLRSC